MSDSNAGASSDTEGYLSNPDMEDFVGREFNRAIEQEEEDQQMNIDKPQLVNQEKRLVQRNPSTSEEAPDLPPSLVQVGWQKCWSKRENRFYYFNSLTSQSLWEMPPLPPEGLAAPKSPTGAPRKDPLGLISAGTSTAKVAPVHNNQLLGRRKSSEMIGPRDSKIQAFELFWDFSVESDAIVMECAPCNYPAPHPEAEQLRGKLVNQLRQQYQDMCHSREGIAAPQESFNRWILERKTCDQGNEPFFPQNCAQIISPAMYREIMHDIPIRLSRIKYLSDARKQLFRYAEAAKKMIETRDAPPESRKLVKWHTEETFSWLRRERNALLEDYLDRLTHLRRQCGPHLATAAKASVEGICTKMYNLSQDYAKKIYNKHLGILTQHNIEIPKQPPASARLIKIHPAVMITPSPRLKGVTIETDAHHARISYCNEIFRVNLPFLKKLELLYKCSCKDDPTMELFLARLWCLLRRYQSMFGPNQYEGIVLQGALPIPVMECLHRTFGVTVECFASPLNCYFKHYLSAFTDTDSYFGSSGPVLQFFPVSGSFEANPPFAEELMESMVNHFEKLLEQSNQPLSFIVFVPEWSDPTPVATLQMENSVFKRKQVLIPAFEHEYRSGLQHVEPSKNVNHKSVHGTIVFFLQNQEGFEKWGPTPERLQELVAAFKPSARFEKLRKSASSNEFSTINEV